MNEDGAKIQAVYFVLFSSNEYCKRNKHSLSDRNLIDFCHKECPLN